MEDSSLILLQTFLGFAYALGCMGVGIIVVKRSNQCLISRQYLCQGSFFGLGMFFKKSFLITLLQAKDPWDYPAIDALRDSHSRNDALPSRRLRIKKTLPKIISIVASSFFCADDNIKYDHVERFWRFAYENPRSVSHTLLEVTLLSSYLIFKLKYDPILSNWTERDAAFLSLK